MTLGVLTLGSYITGLLRDRIFAHTFGASPQLDAYNAAFLVPDFLFNMLVASGIAAAFVPLFTELWLRDRHRANEYARTILSAAVGFSGLIALGVIAAAPVLSTLAAPGFTQDQQHLVAKLMRILALSPLFFAASNSLGSLLVAKQRLFFYGLSPLLYNLGIIGGTLLLAPSLGIMGTAMGTVAGALLHFLARLYDATRTGFRYQVRLRVRTSEFSQTLWLMLPKVFGHPLELATFWVFTAIASGLATGSIAILNFARNFQSVPVAVIGIAVGTAAFPLLARAAAQGSAQEFSTTLRPIFWVVFLASILAALALFALSVPLVAMFLGGKAFSTAAVTRTAITLSVFAFAVPPETLSQLLSRAYYATKNTLLPVLFSLIGFTVSVGSALLLTPTFGILALPFAFTIGSLVKLLLLIGILPLRLRQMEINSSQQQS